MHLVHQNNDDKTLAVVSILMMVPDSDSDYPRSDHGQNVFLDDVGWNELPASEQEWHHSPNEADRINIFEALPFDLSYYHYQGP